MRTSIRRWLACATLLLLLCGGCASVVDQAEGLARSGRYEEALQRLDAALRERPDDAALRTAHARQRERVLTQALAQAELALAGGRLPEAERLLERARGFDSADGSRVAVLSARLAQAVLARQQTREAARERPLPVPPAAAVLGAAFQKPVTLEFRDAALRQVFEALARSTGVNFVFDKDVRADNRVSVFLRGVTLDEAMRVILATQQLDRKLLNDNTVMVYPNTPVKQREHQELVTRSLFLVNTEAKLALPLVRTMTKTRDLYVDERLNALIVRDTPEVVRLVEQLLATIDLPEPEVMLAVEVMEVASSRLDELGVQWPASIGFGVPGLDGSVPINGGGFRGFVSNPALAAQLRATVGSTNLLANPTIRARNREKAKVQIGEKLPVFTTTSAVNVGTSASVSYLDVGLKLDVEPSVQMDGEVTIKVALEVSNLLRQVSGPAGSIAYQIGTRMSTTSLRLKDGETQVLAGLINDEDRRSTSGLPGLSQLPMLGRLFGAHHDTRDKTEIVMLITPRILRNVTAPDTQLATLASGTDSLPGALPLRLRTSARAGVGAGRGGGAAPAAATPAEAALPAGALQLSASSSAKVGETLAVTLANRSAQRASGELQFDPALVQPASAMPPGSAPGRWAFVLEPQGEAVLVLRVLPPAAGQGVVLQASADLPVEGVARVDVPALEAAR